METCNKPTPRALVVQDISCLGRCSMTVAVPALSALGVQAIPMPTAVLSTHTGGFGAPARCDLTDFLLQSIEHGWDTVYSLHEEAGKGTDNPFLKMLEEF